MTVAHKASHFARRHLIKTAGLTAAATALTPRLATASARRPELAAAPSSALPLTPGKLAFFNTHTGEKLSLVYRERGEYLTDAMAAIDHLLRDHRTDEVAAIDPALLDQLSKLGKLLGANQPFHVISGYRSPKTNAMLAARSGGVAKKSLHMLGQAIDIRLPGRPLTDVRRAALSMQAGGVGYYHRSNFVHLDTGRVRAW